MPEPAEIRTRRLLLRRPRPEDTDSFVEVHTRPETHVHSGFGRRTREQALQLLELIQRDWQETGVGYWSILTTGSGELIGFGGLRHADDEGAPILNLYFRFQPFAWGNGYATEMSAAALGWAQHNRPDIPVLVRTATRNAPAIGVANKLGLELVEERLHEGVPEVVFRSPHPGLS
ncbi:GNAT family N-acetyltransferase [Saccharopolyspora griseoalba]|uniref:GNAT family N-acetyltransferase n=1 Tax=Saccharopolyspora griseoalba TaxID=1431848 RepID=A0ABW2LH21_9PSEU